MKKLLFNHFAFLILIIVYGIKIVSQYLSFDQLRNLGYLDFQQYWQSLSDFATGKIIYRDFLWEYGALYLIIGQPIFLLLGKTFASSIAVRYLVLPVISVVLSFLIGKQFLKRRFLFLFLLLLFLHEVNYDFTSLRHILPELGLVTVFFNPFLGGLTLGLSFLSSLDYALPAVIAVILYFLVFRRFLGKFLLGFLPIPVIYFTFLLKNNAINNYLTLLREFSQTWYFNSPCREFFPRLMEEFPFQRLNLYFIPLLILLGFFYALRTRQFNWSAVLFYSLLISYRPLITPCLGYLDYGLTLPFLFLVFLLSQEKISANLKKVIIVVVVWLFLSASNNLSRLFPSLSTPDTSLSDAFSESADFIRQNSLVSDYLFVYPHGPYNLLASRPRPVTVSTTVYTDLAPSFNEITLNELRKNKPKLIAINVYNGWNVKSASSNVPYNVHDINREIIFAGLITPMENFIAENYEIVFKNRVAWVLALKKTPSPPRLLYVPYNATPLWQISLSGLTPDSNLFASNVYRVTGDQHMLEITTDKPLKVDAVKIPFKSILGPQKTFSKYVVSVYINRQKLLNRQIISANWQDLWIFPPEEIKSITLSISENKGFFWWSKPESIEIQSPDLFLRNADLQIQDSAFKK